MNETRLCTIEQIEQFFSGSAQIEFSRCGDDTQRYEHISRVLKRFDYPRRNKRAGCAAEIPATHQRLQSVANHPVDRSVVWQPSGLGPAGQALPCPDGAV